MKSVLGRIRTGGRCGLGTGRDDQDGDDGDIFRVEYLASL
jgi:hypothetical protein